MQGVVPKVRGFTFLFTYFIYVHIYVSKAADMTKYSIAVR